MKYYYAARIETDGGATEIDGAQVVLAEDYDRLRDALEKMITREPSGFVTHEVAVMQGIARAALQEAGDE